MDENDEGGAIAGHGQDGMPLRVSDVLFEPYDDFCPPDGDDELTLHERIEAEQTAAPLFTAAPRRVVVLRERSFTSEIEEIYGVFPAGVRSVDVTAMFDEAKAVYPDRAVALEHLDARVPGCPDLYDGDVPWSRYAVWGLPDEPGVPRRHPDARASAPRVRRRRRPYTARKKDDGSGERRNAAVKDVGPVPPGELF